MGLQPFRKRKKGKLISRHCPFKQKKGHLSFYRDDLMVKCQEMSLVLDPLLPNGRAGGRWPLTPQPTSGHLSQAAAGLGSSSVMNFSRCYSQQAVTYNHNL
jgi:hypothetical protein